VTDDRHPFIVLCCPCGRPLRVKLGCGDRTCPECRKKWFGYHFKTLLALVAGWKSAYFLTLTTKNIREIGRSDVRTIRESFGRLCRYFKQIRGGFYVVQATNKGKGWHLHLHVLFDGFFIDQKALARAWLDITGDSFVVDIRKVTDPGTAVRYLLSDFLQAPRIRPGDAEEFNGVFKGSRLVQPFGLYRKTKFRVPYRCPDCGRSEWINVDVLFGSKKFRRHYEDDT